MADKTRCQTYNFLLENKTIEDIKKQTNIEVIEKRRHGGKTYKLIDANNVNNQIINDDLSENEIFYDTYDTVDDLNNIPISETLQSQSKIQELEKEIQQLKNEKLKQSNINFDKFKYNAITIYDKKQSKKTGINKIHEEILLIEDKIIFITTLIHIDNSITEEIIYFQQLTNGNIEVLKQNKQYENINEYKKDVVLCENYLHNKSNVNIKVIPIKEFLKKHNNFKLKPTKKDWKTWGFIIVITLLLVVVAPICTFVIPTLIPATATVLLLETKVIIAVSFAVAGLIFKEVSSIFENTTQKVKSWFKNKYFKNKEQKEKEKKERQSIIKKLSVDKLETKLQTQYDILKQELDNKKDMKPDKLINNNKINHTSNNISENLDIESENNQNFDSSIKNTVNQQMPKPSTSSNHKWNKVKCLLTT